VVRKNAKAESFTSSVEFTLTSFRNCTRDGVQVMALQGEKCDNMAILHKENV
jgi:hypothetical protein